MDGFDSLGRTKLIMATNRPDTLDPALLRPGRLDRKIEVPLPNEQARLEILKIHARPVNKGGEIDYEAIVKVSKSGCSAPNAYLSLVQLSDGFNGADLRNVVTEAGMFAIRDDREYVNQEDLTKAARKVGETKKHESKHCFALHLSLFMSSYQSQNGILGIDTQFVHTLASTVYHWPNFFTLASRQISIIQLILPKGIRNPLHRPFLPILYVTSHCHTPTHMPLQRNPNKPRFFFLSSFIEAGAFDELMEPW